MKMSYNAYELEDGRKRLKKIGRKGGGGEDGGGRFDMEIPPQ